MSSGAQLTGITGELACGKAAYTHAVDLILLLNYEEAPNPMDTGW